MIMELSNLHALQPDGDPPAFATALPAQAALIAGLLRKLQSGAVRVHFPDGQSELFGDDAHPVSLRLKEWDVCGAVLKRGDIGFAEAYIEGQWDTDDLPPLLGIMLRNRQALETVIYGTWWGSFAYRLRHLFNRNSKGGSRKNIHAHYDLGNDFYREWLDASMTYSSALFAGEERQSLESAQQAKYRRILDQLQLDEGARVLEIGCGWGGFAEAAARERGAQVTGLTLSTEQLDYARARMQRAGLQEHVQLLLQDYRDTEGRFDAIASIEMFEAVGEAYWPDYFRCIARNLRAGGRACIQTIVIDDVLFERYRKGTDFIQQYIFPGGMLPSPSAFRKAAERHGLEVNESLAFGLDYGHTLALWRRDFHAKLDIVRAQGFDERFIRTWDFYLAYCEAGFRAGSVDVMQFTLVKQDA